VRKMFTVATVTALLALAASFGGAIHPAGDSLALARPRRWVALPGTALCLAALAGVAWHKLAAASPGPLSVYQKNMFFLNSDLEALAADILSQAPDVITLQEVSVRNEPLLEMLRRAYPHQHLCRSTSVRGLAVLSRLPAGRSRFCDPTGGMAGLRLESEFGPVWAVSLHLVWPWPLPQAEQVRRLAPQLAALEAPVILGGDFNMVPWSFAVGRLARASGTRRAGRVPPSFRLGPLPMPIDHVFAPGGGSALPRPFTGSDHRGLMARVRL